MDIEWKEPTELETLALKIIRAHQPNALEKPQEINILNFVKLACEKFGYEFKLCQLPKKGNQQALGCLDTKNKKLLLDVNMVCRAGSSNMWTFVAAHELGHLVLHRQYFEDGQSPYDYSDLEGGFPRNNRLEWQANRFASELLLPREMVKNVVSLISFHEGITNNFGKIYIDGKHYNYRFLNKVCDVIANIFKVSNAVAKIRLMEIDLIIDEQPKGSWRRIGDMF